MEALDQMKAMAASNGAAPAIVQGLTSVSYREFADRVNARSAELAANGVKAGDGVGMELESRAMLPELLFACWSLRAYAVPLDIRHPPARREQALKRAHATWLIPAGSVQWTAEPLAGSESLGRDDLAYAMLTSGSTGEPKCVGVTRSNVDWLVGSAASSSGLIGHRRWSAIHSPAFDFAVWESIVPLANGAATVVIGDETIRDPFALSEALSDSSVDLFSTTPQLLYVLVDLWRRHGLPSTLRTIVSGGDALDASRISGVQQQNSAIQIVNMYGITETTVHVTGAADKAGGGGAGIGRPLDGASISIRAACGAKVGRSGSGEIWVAGDGVSAGYLGDAWATAKSFVPDDSPGAVGRRAYRSGDLARLSDDGTAHYLGRTDDEIEVRGHRVSPAEVEHSAREVPGVTDCVVGMVADGESVGRLAIVYTGDTSVTSALTEHLAGSLPSHMVPTLVRWTERLPLSTTGKRDRAAALRVFKTETESSTRADSKIASIWARLLGNPPTTDAESFFAIGGDSLLAMRLLTQIERQTGVRIPLGDFFEAPTLGTLVSITKESL